MPLKRERRAVRRGIEREVPVMNSEAQEPRRYTYGDLMEWDDGRRYELYDGLPVALASPSNVHQLVLMELAAQLHDFLKGKTCKVYPSPFDVRLFDTAEDRPEDSENVVQPDLMVVCDPSKVDRHGIHGAPDLVIEITSPSTRRNDRLVKFNRYQRAGVREYWIVDPDTRIVLVHTLEEGQYHAADAYTVGAQVPVGIFEDFHIDLASVFPE